LTVFRLSTPLIGHATGAGHGYGANYHLDANYWRVPRLADLGS
jgi:hypothetical protein